MTLLLRAVFHQKRSYWKHNVCHRICKAVVRSDDGADDPLPSSTQTINKVLHYLTLVELNPQ